MVSSVILISANSSAAEMSCNAAVSFVSVSVVLAVLVAAVDVRSGEMPVPALALVAQATALVPTVQVRNGDVPTATLSDKSLAGDVAE